jgi:uncharacterized protein YdhG (YjbR/CyaY superfamily)
VRRAQAKRVGEAPSGARRVDEYLAKLSPEMRRTLTILRTTTRSAAPGAKETISYRVPAFRHNGALLVWYAGFERHGSLFPGLLDRVPELDREPQPFKAGRGTLRFTANRPLPRSLVTRLVRARMKQERNPSGRAR